MKYQDYLSDTELTDPGVPPFLEQMLSSFLHSKKGNLVSIISSDHPPADFNSSHTSLKNIPHP